jgi:hypothetical protein
VYNVKELKDVRFMHIYIDYFLQGAVALTAVASERMLAKKKLAGWSMAVLASSIALVFF